MKKLVRLTESDLHRIVKESVDRILNEVVGDATTKDTEMEHDWDDYEDAIGYPVNNDDVGHMRFKYAPQDYEYMKNAAYRDRTNDSMPFHQNKHGEYGMDVLNHLYNNGKGKIPKTNIRRLAQERNRMKADAAKMKAADKRWQKAADSRPLYGKKSPNNEIPK